LNVSISDGARVAALVLPVRSRRPGWPAADRVEAAALIEPAELARLAERAGVTPGKH
jgi:hypothetical protein